jgi:hypothetical protein
MAPRTAFLRNKAVFGCLLVYITMKSDSFTDVSEIVAASSSDSYPADNAG